MDSVQYTKQLPIKYETDICVVGGGPAGTAAGVVAARDGAKVMIIEAHGFFGGAGTASLVPGFMQFTNGLDFMAGGFGKEIYDATKLPFDGLGIDAELLKRTYDNKVKDSGADFLFHTTMIDVITTGDHVEYIIVAAKSGVYAIKAKVYIDATGDGDLCVWAGAPYKFGDENGKVMPSTLCSSWINVDWSRVVHSPDNREVGRAYDDGIFTQEDYHMPGMWRTGENTAGGNIGHCYGIDATDERSLTDGMILGRKLIPEFEVYYRNYIKYGYENTRAICSGSYLGIRESRRIIGDYILSVDDFINKANFTDEIGRYSYPIDVHPELGKENYSAFLKEHTSLNLGKGESYGIPYRSLIPQKLSNVLVSGRCISTDKKMQSSVRVMPGCYITGQACGMAASMAAKSTSEVRDIDVKKLQDKLVAIGGWLPNRK